MYWAKRGVKACAPVGCEQGWTRTLALRARVRDAFRFAPPVFLHLPAKADRRTSGLQSRCRGGHCRVAQGRRCW
eukprot:2332025-Pyramimonas_sp.AAC.1